ncbi:MAG: protein kinase, partial [Actinobacteria bacterium]|nr:protein kinase [Actinomycetota bacterium]
MRRGDLIAERYELDHGLGRGGMAEVWCARDVRLDRPVAVKFLAREFSDDPEFLVRFFAEAQSVASLSHPNVVSVLDFGQFEDRPYLVMEYVSGGSLADLAGKPLLPERVLEFIEQAARGAGAAHANGVVHRDLKPANILLDDEGRPKLADFGIAASRGGERMTQTGQAIGSPHYISPEQVSGQTATPASDVYSLGIVLYQLLTGVRPYEHENLTAVAISHVDSEPDPPSAFNDDLDPTMDALVLRCLSKDPEERYADGDELADAIASESYLYENEHLLDIDDDVPRRGVGRKVALGVAALLVVTAVAVAGMLSSGSRDPAPATNDEPSTEQEISQPNKPKPSPDSTAEPSLTTTGSSDSEPKEEPAGNRRADSRRSGGGGGKPAPGDAEPEPEPTP